MRKFFLAIYMWLLGATVYGQTILGMNVVPPNPTTLDSITVYADLSYQSGGCDTRDQILFALSGSSIYAVTHHCVGMLAFICNDMDTIPVGKLQAGTYTFSLTSTAGALPAPCTPGIVPSQATITFVVTNASSINETSFEGTSIYYSNNTINIASQLPFADGAIINIHNMMGQQVLNRQLENASKQLIPVSLTSGAYIITLQNAEGKRVGQQKIVVAN